MSKSLNINKYKFEFNRISPQVLQCFVIHKGNKNRFGIILNAAEQPPNEWLFDLFIQKFKEFFVDVDTISGISCKKVEKTMKLLKEKN